MILCCSQEMRNMMDEGKSVDEVTQITWPSPWGLKQRELVRVVWTPPQEEFAVYDEFMQRHTRVAHVRVLFYLCLYLSCCDHR